MHPALAASADGYDPFAAIEELGAGLRAWFPDALAPGGPLLPLSPPFQHTFAGLVMLADWLGSHRAFFPFSNGEEPDRMAFARPRAREALAAVGLAVHDKRALVRAAAAPFERVFPFPPNPMQRAAGECTESRLAILEAETGSGKTEAALWRFKQLFAAGEVDGLYFALADCGDADPSPGLGSRHPPLAEQRVPPERAARGFGLRQGR